MPNMRERVTRLEVRADSTDKRFKATHRRIGALENWLTDESRLREIGEQRVKLLEEVDEIHGRRLAALAVLAERRAKRSR